MVVSTGCRLNINQIKIEKKKEITITDTKFEGHFTDSQSSVLDSLRRIDGFSL